MIWFACHQCGKKHNRPETSVGSMIFCDCGQSLTVPWDSTIEEPEPALPAEPIPEAPAIPIAPSSSSPPVPPPMTPQLVPVPVSEERVPPRRRPPESDAIPVVRPHRGRRRGEVKQRDRHRCFNHQHIPSEMACDACTERFCMNCLVKFEGKTLCGPCKNCQIHLLDVPPKLSTMAVTSAIVGMVICVAGFCLMPVGAYMDVLPMIVFALLLQLGTLGLGALALYRLENSPLLRGRSLAVIGMVSSSVGMLLTVAATMYSYLQWI